MDTSLQKTQPSQAECMRQLKEQEASLVEREAPADAELAGWQGGRVAGWSSLGATWESMNDRKGGM